MDPQLEETIREVMNAVESAGYSDAILRNYRKEFGSISDELSEISSVHVYLDSIKTLGLLREGTGLRRRCHHLLATTLVNGKPNLSLNVTRRQVMPKSNGYCQLYSEYIDHLRQQGHAESSIRTEGCLARKYLIYLESIGCLSIDNATADTIISFVVSLRDSWQATSIGSGLSLFRPFVRYLGRDDLVYAAESIKAPRKRAILQVLNADEQVAIQNVLQDNLFTERDRAITLLSLCTGIRACDIVALRIGDIDFPNECISLIQSKTKNPLVLPLTVPIGNALFKYLNNERPDSTLDNVFLRSRAPHCELKNSSAVYNTIRKVLIAAGLQIEGRQNGTRMLRHSAASTMLARGNTLSTIAAVLGHAKQSSTSTYISVDEENLKRCTLPIVGRWSHE